MRTLDGRRGGSMVEILVAMTLLWICVVPALTTMKTQVSDQRWIVERKLAMPLANDLLDLYQQMGYWWIRREVAANGGIQDGALRGDRLNYDSISGYDPVTNYPGGRPAPPCSLNPVLGGPMIVPAAPANPPNAGTFLWNRAVDDDPYGRGSLTRATLEGVYRFRRRVEILGGNFALNGFNPFLLVGVPNPQQPFKNQQCYLVRVTIQTPNGVGTEKRGTMSTAYDAYQVVTVIAAH